MELISTDYRFTRDFMNYRYESIVLFYSSTCTYKLYSSVVLSYSLLYRHTLPVLMCYQESKNELIVSFFIQQERKKDRERMKKKKESDLPGAVMQINK